MSKFCWADLVSPGEAARRAAGRRRYNSVRKLQAQLRRIDVEVLLYLGWVAVAAAILVITACGSGSSSTKTGSTRRAALPSTTAVATTLTTSSPLRVVQAYIDAFDRGDAHVAASQFSSDATFSTPLGSCNPCVGQSVIEQKLGTAIAAHTRIAMSEPNVSGDTLTAKSTLTSPQFPQTVTRAIGTFTAVVRQGRITSLAQQYDRTDPQTDALFRSIGQ